jgi:hypothetical protein
MPSNAYEGINRTRIQGAALALLVQAALITAAILSLTRPVVFHRPLPHEATLWLRPLPHVTAQPKTIDARGSFRRRATAATGIKPSEVLSPALPSGPGTSDLRAFGRALFGCAPEHYAELSPEYRAHCPKPGEGLAYQPPDLMGGPSHVKNNVRWANALAHKQSPLLLPGAFNFPIALLGAVFDGSIGESSSDFRDPEKWPSYIDAGKFMPRDMHDQEREYDAWHKDHPAK